MLLRSKIHLVWGAWRYLSADLDDVKPQLLENLGGILPTNPEGQGHVMQVKRLSSLLVEPEPNDSRLVVTTCAYFKDLTLH